MEVFLTIFSKIAFFALNIIFLIIYIANLILNLMRDIKLKKELKSNPQIIKGRVRDIKIDKKRAFLIVEFDSPTSRILFTQNYEYMPHQLKDSPYQIGDEVELHYVSTEGKKRVVGFPLVLKGDKVKLETGPLFTNALLVFFAGFNSVNVLVQILNKGGFLDKEQSLSGIFGGGFYLLLIIVLYAMLLSYVYESLTSMSRVSNHNYLKVYGIKGKAQVKTFKFGGAKNASGHREARMEITYYTSTGEKIETRLNSYMYSETQEEFIDIIYDPKKSNNVVYLRQ